MTTTQKNDDPKGRDERRKRLLLAVDFTEEEEGEEKRWRKATRKCIFGTNDDANDNNEVVFVVCGGDSKREHDHYAWKGKSPLRDASSLKHFAEILLGEDQKHHSTIALLCGGVGCQGAKMVRAFQLYLGLAASKRRGARTITMSIERKNIVPAQRTNGNRHDWLRVAYERVVRVGVRYHRGRRKVAKRGETVGENDCGKRRRDYVSRR